MYLVDSTNYFCLPTLCERNTHFYLLHLAYVCIIKNIILRFSTLSERKVKNGIKFEKRKLEDHVRDHSCRKQSGERFYLGCSGHGLHHRRRLAFKLPHALLADPQIPLCHAHHGRAHVPKKRCLGRFHDAVSGCMHGAGRHSGHGQHCRCGGRYCDRRPGRGILDVVFRTARYVHKVCGSYVGGAFS